MRINIYTARDGFYVQPDNEMLRLLFHLTTSLAGKGPMLAEHSYKGYLKSLENEVLTEEALRILRQFKDAEERMPPFSRRDKSYSWRESGILDAIYGGKCPHSKLPALFKALVDAVTEFKEREGLD